MLQAICDPNFRINVNRSHRAASLRRYYEKMFLMKHTHIIQDIATGLYFREVNPGDHQPTAAEHDADFYDIPKAQAIVALHYAGQWAEIPPEKLYIIREGPASAYMSWMGRRGGRVVSDAKRKANRKRARRKKGMTYDKQPKEEAV